MAATKTKPFDLGTAAKEAQEAQEAADRLEAELKAGDMSISPADVRQARDEAQDAALRLEGMRSAQAKKEREDLEQRGAELHARFVEDQTTAFEDVEEKITTFTQAATALLDSLDSYTETRDSYKRKWNELFRGNTETPAALKFKPGHQPGGDFGALDDPYTVARNVPPVQTSAALFGEVINRWPKSTRFGIDRQLQGQLNAGGYANGLKALRELRKQLDKEKGSEK